MRTITLEEHFTTPGFRSGAGKKREEHAAKTGGRLAEVFAKLADVGDKRIAEMDAAGIDMQVLSLTAPGTEQSEAAAAVGEAQEANDFLAAAVKKYPKRFAGFAILPTASPEKAAEELERRVRNDGFVGANIHGHNRGRYLDDKFYWPILERAEALGVPLYLHPTMPPQAVIDASFGGFSPLVTDLFAGPGWGWHIETAIHILRMILGGVFDRYPKLQFVIGHLGEVAAVDDAAGRPDDRGRQAAAPGQRLSARQRALHDLGLHLSAELPQSAARSRRRPDHVLGRLSLCLDGGRPRIPGAASGHRRRQGAHRPRQRREAVQAVKTEGGLAAKRRNPPHLLTVGYAFG